MLSLSELVLSILEDRFVNLPPKSNSCRRYRKLLLRVGFNDSTADKFIKCTTGAPWPGEVPSFVQLLETLEFEYEDCRKVADLALEKSYRVGQPYARRWEQVSVDILAQFGKLTTQRELWNSVKRQWDAGEVVVLGESYALAPSTNYQMRTCIGIWLENT
jgi:hypothetical protein